MTNYTNEQMLELSKEELIMMIAELKQEISKFNQQKVIKTGIFTQGSPEIVQEYVRMKKERMKKDAGNR